MRLPRAAAALAGSLALVAGGVAGAGAIASAAATSTAGTSAARPAAAAAPAASTGAGYWHTSGNQILDAAGDPVRIAGINWYGFETPDEIAHGLWAQDYHAIINDIRSLGYNTIRIPFSNQMVEDPIVPQNLSFYNATGPINTDLRASTRCRTSRRSSPTRARWVSRSSWTTTAPRPGSPPRPTACGTPAPTPARTGSTTGSRWPRRYAGNPTVVGFDLRNEPHTPGG